MSSNPYQPPTVIDSAAKLPTAAPFRSTTVITNVLSGMIVFTAFLTGAVGVLDVYCYATISGYGSGDFVLEGSVLAVTTAMVTIGIGNALVYLVSGITFLVWIHRSTANAHALGAQGIEVTPGWAVGYWFIPILNLFRPYQATCEIYRASVAKDPINWKSDALPGFFPVWWFCWIVGGFLSRIEARAASNGLDLGGAGLPLSVSSTLLGIGSAVFCVMVVREISSSQQSRSEFAENQF